MKLDRRTDVLSLAPSIVRLVALGDPHGDLLGLERALALEGGAGAAFVSVGDNVGYADGPTSSELCRRLEARGIASVSGNHEAWMDDDGTLAILANKTRVPRKLEAGALRWCAALPLRLDVALAAAPDLVVIAVHTILDEERPLRWDYVSLANASTLVAQEGADVVLVGHSHGPAIYVVGPRGATREVRLGLASDAPLVEPIVKDHRYVVDAGSLARPAHHPDPGRFDRATLAVLDLERRSIALRAFAKPP